MSVHCAYLYVGESHPHNEIASPVAAASQSNGRRAWSLAEQLCHNEPRDGTRSHLKEAHKQEDGRHADVAHPGERVLGDRKQEAVRGCQTVYWFVSFPWDCNPTKAAALLSAMSTDQGLGH